MTRTFRSSIKGTVTVNVNRTSLQIMNRMRPRTIQQTRTKTFTGRSRHRFYTRRFASLIDRNSPALFSRRRQHRQPAINTDLFFRTHRGQRNIPIRNRHQRTVNSRSRRVSPTKVHHHMVARNLHQLVVRLTPRIQTLRVTISINNNTIRRRALTSAFNRLYTSYTIIGQRVRHVTNLHINMLRVRLHTNKRTNTNTARNGPHQYRITRLRPQILQVGE